MISTIQYVLVIVGVFFFLLVINSCHVFVVIYRLVRLRSMIILISFNFFKKKYYASMINIDFTDDIFLFKSI